MNFAIPQTKAAMYETLREIFAYYRIQRTPLEEQIDMTPLSLEREVFVSLSTEALRQKAINLLGGKYQLEKQQKSDEYLQKIIELSNKEGLLYQSYTASVDKIDADYDEIIEKVKKEAKKNGLISSDVTVAEISRLESERVTKKSEANQKFDQEQAEINSQISSLEFSKNNIEEFYDEFIEQEIVAKVTELQDEQDTKMREIFRYNNGLDEKEQKNANAIIQANANLKLKYAEINSQELSKDKLIELGYYSDVIDCICAYYDNAFSDPVTLYRDILDETQIAVYLEDYYSDVILMYRTRAGA